ncbi:uncharacterized protein [Triticum aestivum]|uniref:uncharacterized protein isoform X1 n=1 Tax=Triticum aestivum TaxID=4565 RepID=UPI001D032691|nr:uncharacterized protein LOC123117532 isoform X1 [Triticum aestivum]
MEGDQGKGGDGAGSGSGSSSSKQTAPSKIDSPSLFADVTEEEEEKEEETALGLLGDKGKRAAAAAGGSGSAAGADDTRGDAKRARTDVPPPAADVHVVPADVALNIPPAAGPVVLRGGGAPNPPHPLPAEPDLAEQAAAAAMNVFMNALQPASDVLKSAHDPDPHLKPTLTRAQLGYLVDNPIMLTNAALSALERGVQPITTVVPPPPQPVAPGMPPPPLCLRCGLADATTAFFSSTHKCVCDPCHEAVLLNPVWEACTICFSETINRIVNIQ